jgi:hypothetical protein
MSDSNPKKHHYVPECYLKSFGNTQKTFWRRKKDIAKATICTAAQVAYEIDSNKIRTEEYLMFNDISDHHYIEKFAFKKQENNYSKTLNQITKFSLSPLIIDKEKYRLFIETLVCIKRRNPSTRNMLIETFRQAYDSPTIIEDFKKYLYKASEYVDNDIDVDKYIDNFMQNKAKEPSRLNDMYLTGFLKNEDNTIIESMTNDLYRLDQFILHAPINSEFITCDNPGFLVSNNNTVISAGGLGENFEFYFPLTPNTCLYIDSMKKESKNLIEKVVYPRLLDLKQVFEINQCTKQISNYRLFGRNKTVLEQV